MFIISLSIDSSFPCNCNIRFIISVNHWRIIVEFGRSEEHTSEPSHVSISFASCSYPLSLHVALPIYLVPFPLVFLHLLFVWVRLLSSQIPLSLFKATNVHYQLVHR